LLTSNLRESVEPKIIDGLNNSSNRIKSIEDLKTQKLLFNLETETVQNNDTHRNDTKIVEEIAENGEHDNQSNLDRFNRENCDSILKTELKPLNLKKVEKIT